MPVTAAIYLVKDEADIIEFTIRRMLAEVDFILVQDNGSTDGTREILGRLPVEVFDDPDPAYYQSAKTSALATQAAERGADWVISADADEVWGSEWGRVADVLAEMDGACIATAELYDHVATGLDVSETVEPDPTVRIGWRRREVAALPKVAVRPRPRLTIHQGNHGADFGSTAGRVLTVRHFPYRSVSQFESKVRNGARAYAATDLPEDVGKHWRDYGRILDEHGPDALADVFRRWFWTSAPERDPSLIFDPAPVASVVGGRP